MAVQLHERHVFTWSEWAAQLGAEIKLNPERAYYESWLSALETLVEIKALIGHDERHARIDAWERAAQQTPHGQPIELKNGSHHRT